MASTLATLYAAYDDNADYDVDNSTAKAKLFIAACRRLLSPQFSPRRSKGAGGAAGEVEVDLEVIRDSMRSAEQWLAQHDVAAAASIVHPDFAGFRR